MWKVGLLVLTLSGCASSWNPMTFLDKPVYHPPLPVPYTTCPVSWQVLEVGGKAKVVLSYQDNVTAAQCRKDIERYISQLITTICHYRQELKEGVCIEH